MLAAVNADGYSGASIAQVIARAGVSRATFYEHFSDKDACFLALYQHISRQLLDQIGPAINNDPPERALDTAVRQLTEHAEREPARARLLASDVLAGGPRALAERERTISRISEKIRAANAVASPRAPSPDIPAGAVISAVQRLISQRVWQGERSLAHLNRELTDWLTHYEEPTAKHRWSTLSASAGSDHSPGHSRLADELPPCVLYHASRPLYGDLAQERRRRILCATAESAMQSGYAATTVTAIIARAGLHKQAFYDIFRDKRQAFLVVHELVLQQSMYVGATAYFNAGQWPERVWRCLLAMSQFYAAYPALAHVALVETHALGPDAIQRAAASRQTFTTLLRTDRQDTDLVQSVTIAEAIGLTICEIARDRIRHQGAAQLPRYAYHATYLALAPFLGVQAANQFVQRKLEGARRRSQ